LTSPGSAGSFNWAALEAIATAAGVLVAVAALVAAILAYRMQQRQIKDQNKALVEQQKINAHQTAVLELQAADLRDSLRERREAQAILVVLRRERPPRGTGQDMSYVVRMVVVNTSYMPIYDVGLRWVTPTGRWALAEFAYGNGDKIVEVVPPHEPGGILPPHWPVEVATNDLAEQMSAIVYFRDSAGQHWQIDRNGGRIALTPDEAAESYLSEAGIEPFRGGAAHGHRRDPLPASE
jgi:hypothetical protein